MRLAEQGFLALKDIHANFGLGYLHLYLGMSHFALGKLHLAQTSYRDALDLAATHFPHESQRIEALACIAECQYYANDLAGARRNVDAALTQPQGPSRGGRARLSSDIPHGGGRVRASLGSRWRAVIAARGARRGPVPATRASARPYRHSAGRGAHAGRLLRRRRRRSSNRMGSNALWQGGSVIRRASRCLR